MIRNKPWLVSILMVGPFMVAIGLLLLSTREQDLHKSGMAAAESIQLPLQGNQDYLLLLAQERARGKLTKESFQEIGSQYVADHRELINITWVDAEKLIRTVAPPFDVWVPVFRDRQFMGLFAGVDYCQQLLEQVLAKEIGNNHLLKLENETGKIVG